MFEKSTSDARPFTEVGVSHESHRCLAGARCRHPETVDGQRIGVLTAETGVLCDACVEHIASCTRQLPQHWARLRVALGERQADALDKVRSTPRPAIPISAARDALMSAIVEVADRAAAIVADALRVEQSDGRRKPPPDVHYLGQRYSVEEGSPAHLAEEQSRPDDWRRLNACVALVEPHINLLATSDGDTAAQVWCSPRRCDVHADAVLAAEVALAAGLRMPDCAGATPKQVTAFLRKQFRGWLKNKKTLSEAAEEAMDGLQKAFAQAAVCDDCNAWNPVLGQARELVDITGLKVALDIVELHNRVRADLGKTRLRHRYAMPCPRCGGRIGRDDGVAIVNCESCSGAWTERDYKFLSGLIVDEGKEVDILKYLLAEGYSRLDDIHALLDTIRGDTRINVPGTGVAFLIEQLDKIMGDHAPAKEREVATDKKAAAERQVDEDNWAWKNEQPYKKPRPKRKVARKSDAPLVAASSRSLVTDVDLTDLGSAAGKCSECNCVHAGECA